MIVIGHSHANAVATAARAGGQRLRLIQLREYGRRQIVEGGELGTVVRAALDERLRESPEGPVYSTIGGSIHVALGLSQHPIPFDFVVPGRDIAFATRATVLPYTAVCTSIYQMTKYERRLLVALKRHVSVPLIHLNCPPPSRKVEIVRDKPGCGEPTTFEVSPAGLRYKLWLVTSRVLERFCRKVSIVFVPPPVEALDGDGFLLDHFHRDAAHGNEEYGRLVIDQMRAAG